MDRKKILIIKIGAIGDVVMTMPLLTHFQKEKITWVIGKSAAPLVKPFVEELITVDEEKLFKGSFIQKLWELFKIQSRLAGRTFSLVLIGHIDWRYRLFSLFTFAKKRRFFQKNGKRACPLPGRYHGSEILRLATLEDNVKLEELELPSFPKSASEHLNLEAVVLAPGGAKNILADDALRRWPIEHYVTLAKELHQRNIPVILTGGKTDEWVIPHFTEIPCKNLIGKLDILELVSLLQGVKLLVTHDTGPLHLAKLARCKAIALFGPTNPLEKIGKKDNIVVFWGGKDLACRPCYDGKTYAACTKNICLKRILPIRVLQKILQL